MKKNKTKVIYNYIDADYVRRQSLKKIYIPTKLREWIDDGLRLVVTIGRLVDEKDHIKLVRQFVKCVERENSIRLIIVGGGLNKDSLLKEIERLGVEEYVFITGELQNPFPILRNAEVFVLSSFTEGYPNVLFEAMALGIPIVAVDCFAGPREILDDNSNYKEVITGSKIAKRGVLVGSYDSDREGITQYLADAIIATLNDNFLKEKVVGSSSKWLSERTEESIFSQWDTCIDECYRSDIIAPTYNKIERGKTYIIYGTGIYAKRIYKDLIKRGCSIFAFVVSDNSNERQLYGRPVYQREYLLKQREGYEVIFGIQNYEYANQVSKWLMENKVFNIIFYSPEIVLSLNKYN